MKICVAQLETRAGDFAASCDKMADWSARAASQGAELVVYPITALTGLSGVSAADREGFFADAAQALSSLAPRLACPALVPVAVALDDDPVFEALYLDGDSVVPMRLLAQVKSAAEEAAQQNGGPEASGLTLPVLQAGGLDLGIAFTYEDLADFVQYDYKVDAVVFISTYGFAADDPESAMGCSLAESRFSKDADAMAAWVVGVGGLGCCDCEVFTGSSFAVAPWGQIAAQAPAFEEALMCFEMDKGAEGPLTGALEPQVYDPTLMAWEAAVQGTRALVSQLGKTDAHVLLDGGLLPMLVCCVAVDALGPMHVCPWVLRTGDAAADAANDGLVRNLRLDARVIGTDELGRVGDDPELIRAVAFAHMASAARVQGACTLGCADKTALALGGGRAYELGSVLPLADLYRSDALALCRMRNTVSPVIPASARDRYDVEDVPGLSKVARDPESRLEVLDYALSSYIEWERPLTQIAQETGDEGLARTIVSVARASMAELPGRLLAPVLSSKTLDEARSPIGLSWRDRVRSAKERLDLEGIAQKISEEAQTREGSQEGSARGFGEALELFGLLGQVPGPQEQPPTAGKKGGNGSGPFGIDWSGPFSQN